MTDAALHSGAGPDRAVGTRTARLYERHGRGLYGLCLMLLRDADEAEDALQSTFLAAHRALSRGGAPRDEGAWLAAIARNECRGRIRTRMQTPLHDDPAVLDELPDPAVDPAERIADPGVRLALAALSESQREAVLLRDVVGLRAREVADVLGISRPAVEALLFRARRQLRLRLRPVGLLVVPAAVGNALAQAIPGFVAPAAAAGLAGSAGGAASAGILAKLGAAPTAVKVAAGVAAAATAGSVAAVEVAREPAARPATPPARAQAVVPADDSSGSGGRGGSSESDDDRGGRGSESDGDDDRSGPGGGSDDTSGPGGRGSDDASSGPGSGKAREDEDGGSSGSGSGSPERTPSDDRSGSDGSGSSGSGSSGSGKAERTVTTESPVTTDTSGRSGSSGSGSSGGGEERPPEPDSSGHG